MTDMRRAYEHAMHMSIMCPATHVREPTTGEAACSRRSRHVGLRSEAIRVELFFRELAVRDEIAPRRIDHDRDAARVDLVRRKIRQVLHHRAVHEARAPGPRILG